MHPYFSWTFALRTVTKKGTLAKKFSTVEKRSSEHIKIYEKIIRKKSEFYQQVDFLFASEKIKKMNDAIIDGDQKRY